MVLLGLHGFYKRSFATKNRTVWIDEETGLYRAEVTANMLSCSRDEGDMSMTKITSLL